MTDDFELEARRAKLAQILATQSQDPARLVSLAGSTKQRALQHVQVAEILDRFDTSLDVNQFRQEIDVWRHFSGVNGQMFLNQLVGNSPDLDVLALS
jgi:hypothetical protein